MSLFLTGSRICSIIITQYKRKAWCDTVKKDIDAYNAYLTANLDQKATDFANQVNDTYIKMGGDERGTASYGAVCDFLVCWHIQQVVLPMQMEEETEFDPFDETQVDLSGIANAKVPNA